MYKYISCGLNTYYSAMETGVVVDYGTELANWDVLQRRGQPTNGFGLESNPKSCIDLLPPPPLIATPSSSIMAKYVHAIYSKSKQPIYSLAWTPSGRRLLTGAMNGEFSLWHGMSFGFEMVMQAHENDIRCMKFSHSGEWLLSGDQDGVIKVWQPNFNNVKRHQVHTEVCRDVAWSPNDTKFATASDDGSVKVWSFATMTEDVVFSGRYAHGWDVKCVDWHPTYSLIASGSKDNTVRLWDPRQIQPIATINEFKNTVTKVKFQPQGSRQLLAAASRANSAHVFDLRLINTSPNSSAGSGSGSGSGLGSGSNSSSGVSGMYGSGSGPGLNSSSGSQKAFEVLRGHPADVSCLQWHPIHPELVSTGTHEGSIHHFLLNSSSYRDELGYMTPAWNIPKAHQWPVWDISYHPLGHILATASNDKSVKIWTRPLPGDSYNDIKVPSMYVDEIQEQNNQVKMLSIKDSAPKHEHRRVPGF